MCEFCVRHGEGKKWYLQAKNYSADLLSDARRRGFIVDFFRSFEQETAKGLESLAKAPRVLQRTVRAMVTRRMKKQHFGQVLPLEDVEGIFGFVNSIVRVPCVCRRATLGRDVRCCYGISVGPGGNAMGELIASADPSFAAGPDTSELERVSKEEALKEFAEHEREGLCHSVWTFGTPFIGGICNCDRADCMAMRATVSQDVKVMFRAEYVAEVDPELCTGCRSCMRVCQFGALAFSASNKKAYVDQRGCYGCGICRSMCQKEAVKLRPRAEVAAVANLW